MNDDKLVFPGDQVSTSEELLPGDGTYEEDGVIRSVVIGRYYVDGKKREACVKPLASVPVLIKKGDLVLAEVNSVRSSMIIANVIHVVGKKRAVSGDTNGTLHVSEISNGYVEDPSSEYATGDILRAKVTQVKPSIQLATKDINLGAIKSHCTVCRGPLVKKDNMLECENCGRKEKRKTAVDYRNFDIDNI